MAIRAGTDGGRAEASIGERHRGGRGRRALLRAVLVLLLIVVAGAAGRVLGGDWYWAGFAAAMAAISVIVIRGAWQPTVNTTVQAAKRDVHNTNVRNNRLTLNAGGLSAVVGAVFIMLVNGLLVAHVSTAVPGGRYYEQTAPESASELPPSPPATEVAPVFLRDLPEEQIRSPSGGKVASSGSRIAGKQCSRSIYTYVASIGEARDITLTPTTRFRRFRALAGVPDEVHPNVRVEFALLGDGQRVIAKKSASPGKPVQFDQDVSAYTTLYLRTTLITSRYGSVYGGDYRAVWGDAQFLTRNGQPSVCTAPAGN